MWETPNLAWALGFTCSCHFQWLAHILTLQQYQKTELTASILKTDPKHTRDERECFLIRQNRTNCFCVVCSLKKRTSSIICMYCPIKKQSVLDLNSVSFKGKLYVIPCSGELQTHKLRSHSLWAQSSKVLLKPGAGQHIAVHATPTARDFFLANFYLLVHSPAFFS